MAPRKRSKKPVKPVRGFMTVSVPSKSQGPAAASSATQSAATTGDRSSVNDGQAAAHQQETNDEVTKEIDNLGQEAMSPEEYEKHLLDSELQTWVDNFRSDCQRESARQVTRLEGEKRMVTSRPTPFLNVVDWLPPDLVDEILEAEKRRLQLIVDQNLSGLSERDLKPKAEEDLCMKLWTLRSTLLGLGFKEAIVDEALSACLGLTPPSSVPKDSIWGLDQAIEWLALYCAPEDLPPYGRKKGVPFQVHHAEETLTEDNSVADLPESGTVTPTNADSKMPKPPVSVELPESEDSEDSDDDPGNLIPRFLSLRTALYKDAPTLFNSSKKKASSNATLSAKASRIQKKLARFEDDPLFDRELAELDWQMTLSTLRLETAAKSRYDNEEKSEIEGPEDAPPVGKEDVNEPIPQDAPDDQRSHENSDDDMIGSLFTETQTTADDEQDKEAGDERFITIRDFGKASGISPCRILADACRARDSRHKITYRTITESSYSNRKEVRITWSKHQDSLPPMSFDHISYTATPNSIRASMDTIATPTAREADWYIATVALFLVFAHYPKESKASMKLPPPFRGLWQELLEVKKSADDSQIKAILAGIRQTVQNYTSSLPADEVLTHNFQKRHTVSTSQQSSKGSAGGVANNHDLVELWNMKSSTPAFQKMQISRASLPIASFRDDILATFEANQVTIICSETGSGKSTQIPSFILEHELKNGRPCKIFCTEPRRISATSLARRVSEELGESRDTIGTTRSLVGYAIRLESKISSSTRLIYATTGVVVRMLEKPQKFEDVTHLLLDEVHERSIDSDFLLIILRRLLHDRPDLKLVLMSATVDAKKFSSYLGQAPILNIPGRTFPVAVNYLEDAIELTGHTPDPGQLDEDGEDSELENVSTPNDLTLSSSLVHYSQQTQRIVKSYNERILDYGLIVALLEKLATDWSLQQYSKAILIFMPGLAEIKRLQDEISGNPFFASKAWVIHALHSSIANEEQEKAFLVPPEGVRKIVIATNIAETGITIPDITAVIDTGKEKVMRFDQRRQFSKLVESYISRANAKQRRGRAGRVQNGICFHLFTRHRHDVLIQEQQTPEMLRLSLHDLVLQAKISGLGDVEQTLSEALDPPSSKNIRRAIEALKDVKALTAVESLTPLGQQLAKLPLDVFLGKLIIYGAFFKCFDAAVTIAAICSSKSPFTSANEGQRQTERAKTRFKKGNSDLLTMYNAYLGWKNTRMAHGESEFTFCRKNCLSIHVLRNIEETKLQLVSSLIDAGFLVLSQAEYATFNRTRSSRSRQIFVLPRRVDVNSDHDLIVDSVIAWALFPRLLVREGSNGWRNISNNQMVKIPFNSVNRLPNSAKQNVLMPPTRYLSYYHMMQSRAGFYQAHETSAVEDFAVVLMCGDLDVRLYSGMLMIDGGHRGRFTVDGWRQAMAIKVLGRRIREEMAQWIQSSVKDDSKKGPSQWMRLWQQIFQEVMAKRVQRLEISGSTP